MGGKQTQQPQRVLVSAGMQHPPLAGRGLIAPCQRQSLALVAEHRGLPGSETLHMTDGPDSGSGPTFIVSLSLSGGTGPPSMSHQDCQSTVSPPCWQLPDALYPTLVQALDRYGFYRERIGLKRVPSKPPPSPHPPQGRPTLWTCLTPAQVDSPSPTLAYPLSYSRI